MKHSISTLATLVISLSIAACSTSQGALVGAPPLASAEPPATPHHSPVASPVPSHFMPSPTPGDPIVIRAYFVLDGPAYSGGLVPVLREVPPTMAVGKAAMNALLDGPIADEAGASPAISTAVPVGTELLSLSIEDGVATVDLSGEFEFGGDLDSRVERLGQVVYTLTQFPTVTSVEFRMEGRPVTSFGSEGVVLHGPVSRAELVEVGFEGMFESVLPSIFVDGPVWGATLGNPGRITGSANTFEAWLMVSLLDASGRVLDEATTTATCGSGCRGTFDVSLAYAVTEAQWGTLRVFDGDESGETDGIIRDYPVWLTPGPPVEVEHVCGC
jgi:germination protein M